MFYDDKRRLIVIAEMGDGGLVGTYFAMQNLALMLKKDKAEVDKNGFIIREIANEKPRPPTKIKGYWDEGYRQWAERWIEVTGLLKQEIKRRKILLKPYREAWDNFEPNEVPVANKDIIDVSSAF